MSAFGTIRRSQSDHSRASHAVSGSSESWAMAKVSGSGTGGISSWCSMPSSWTWKDADIVKMACPS